MFYDLLVLGVLAFTTMRGAAKGIAWQLAGIAAIVLCFAFATPLSASFAPSIPLEQPLNRWVAMLAIYLGFSFVTFGCARGFEGWLEKIKFQAYDRHLGALFGLTKGVALCLVMTFFTVALAHQTRPYILKTHSGFAAAWIMDRLDPLMPEELHTELAPYIHQLDQPGTQPEGDWADRHHESPSGSVSDNREDDGSAFGYSPVRHSKDTGSADSGQASNSETHDTGSNVESLISKIPGMLDRELRKLVMEALKNTLPEDRAELVDKMTSAPPEQVRPIAHAWRGGRPDSESWKAPPQPAHRIQNQGYSNHGSSQETSFQQRAMIRDITQALSKRSEVQTQKAAEIQAALAGIPDQVAIAVLADWKSDLLAIDPDPDSDTDLATPLDVRIVHQLRRAGVPVNRLSSDLQDRLESAVRR